MFSKAVASVDYRQATPSSDNFFQRSLVHYQQLPRQLNEQQSTGAAADTYRGCRHRHCVPVLQPAAESHIKSVQMKQVDDGDREPWTKACRLACVLSCMTCLALGTSTRKHYHTRLFPKLYEANMAACCCAGVRSQLPVHHRAAATHVRRNEKPAQRENNQQKVFQSQVPSTK